MEFHIEWEFPSSTIFMEAVELVVDRFRIYFLP